MKNKYIYIGMLLLGLASCGNEAPFKAGEELGEGSFSKYSISLDVKGEDNIKINSTRASENLIDDFKIEFQKAGTSEAYKTFKYSEMPDVVTLPEGQYTVIATYGEDLDAAWENPHFKGESQEFNIERDKINTDLEPIVCKLQNVMVSVKFDDELMAHMSDDPVVKVWVNSNQPLEFTKSHSDDLIPGYFKHSEVCTLTAEFKGNVDGVDLTEIKTLSNVEAGNHYRLNFSRHSFNGEDYGQVDQTIVIDANVTIVSVDNNIDQEEEKVLEDVTWPTEDPADPKEPDDDNKGDDNPGQDEPQQPSEDSLKVELGEGSTVQFGEDISNEINADTKIIFNVSSKKGLTVFKIDIDSPDETLGAMKLDLINTEGEVANLRGLGLLTSDQESLKGVKEVNLNISTFMAILADIAGTHKFTVTISDGDNPEDTVVKVLVLHVTK